MEQFKPGPYPKGTQVISNGSIWEARINISNAKALPSPNQYWEYIGAADEKVSIKGGVIDLVGEGIINTEFTAQKNSDRLKAFILSYPERATPSVYVRSGAYRMAEAIELHHRPFYIFGDNGTIWGESTRFIFPAGVTGFNITRANSTGQETIIERILVQAEGKNSVNASGFRFLGRVKLRDCTAKGFSWNGFDGYASTTDVSHDISGSLLQSCHSLENGNDGYFLGGTDANSLVVSNCDARDNGGYGFNDNSFLGNNFIGCMAHYNKKGDFNVHDKANARSQFIGCYSEGGSPVSVLSSHSVVIGGTWGTGYTVDRGVVRYGSYVEEYEKLNGQLFDIWQAINFDRGEIKDLKTKVNR